MMVFATLLLFATSGFSQEVSGTTQNGTPQAAVTSNDTVGTAATATTPHVKAQPSKSNLSLFTKAVETPGFPVSRKRPIRRTGNLRSGHTFGSLASTAHFE